MQVEPFPLKVIAPKVAGGSPPIPRSLERLWIGAMPAGDCGPLIGFPAADAQYVPSISGLHGRGCCVESGSGDGPEGDVIGGGGTIDMLYAL